MCNRCSSRIYLKGINGTSATFPPIGEEEEEGGKEPWQEGRRGEREAEGEAEGRGKRNGRAL